MRKIILAVAVCVVGFALAGCGLTEKKGPTIVQASEVDVFNILFPKESFRYTSDKVFVAYRYKREEAAWKLEEITTIKGGSLVAGGGYYNGQSRKFEPIPAEHALNLNHLGAKATVVVFWKYAAVVRGPGSHIVVVEPHYIPKKHEMLWRISSSREGYMGTYPAKEALRQIEAGL